MWWLAFAVRNPFKNSWVIRNVNTLAYSTQFQVVHLMAYQRIFDIRDYGSKSKYGYLEEGEEELEPRNSGWNPYSVFDDRKTSEEKALEKLIEAVNNRNITVTTDNRGLKDIIEKAFDRMGKQTKVTLEEIRDIIEIIMKDIKKYDRDALADELKAIMLENKASGVRPGGLGTVPERIEEAERRKKREQIRQKIRSRPTGKPRGKPNGVSSYLAF